VGRIRTIKPDFFRDPKLQDIQAEHPELNPMLVFAGLWTVADKNGVFEWEPRMLKLDILPFLSYDLGASLVLLERFSLVSRFNSEGRVYGKVLKFAKHQRISGKEALAPSRYPQGSTREVPEKHPGAQEGEKEREKERGVEQIPEAPPDHIHQNQFAAKLLEEIRFPKTPGNIRAVAAAIECEVLAGMSKPAAYEFVLAGTKDGQDQGMEINTFFFTDAKYRIENRSNGHGRPSKNTERIISNREAIIAGLGLSPDVGPRESDLQNRDAPRRNSSVATLITKLKT
jgi:hypothetical protein